MALATILIALGAAPADALAPALPPLARSSNVQVLRIDRKADLSTMPTLTAPVPASWFTTVPAYLPSDTWQFACPVNTVAVG